MGRQVRAGNGEGPLGPGRAASPALPRARAGCGGAARSLSAAQSGAGPPGVPGWCAAPAGERRRRRQQRLPFPRRASSLPLPRRKSGGESRRVGGAGSAAARRRQPSGGGRGPRAGPCPAPAAGGPSHASPAGFGAGLLRETPAPGPGGRRRWRRAFGRAPAGGRSSEGGSGGGTPAGPSRSFPSPQGQVPSVRASAALPLASPGGSKAAKPGGGSKTRAARCDPPGLRAAARGGGCFQGGGSRSREAPGSPSPAPSSSLTRGAVPGRGSLCPPLSAVRPRRKSRPRCGRPRAVSPASKRAAPAGAKRAVSRAPSLAGVARPPAPAAAGSRPVAREGFHPPPPRVVRAPRGALRFPSRPRLPAERLGGLRSPHRRPGWRPGPSGGGAVRRYRSAGRRPLPPAAAPARAPTVAVHVALSPGLAGRGGGARGRGMSLSRSPSANGGRVSGRASPPRSERRPPWRRRAARGKGARARSGGGGPGRGEPLRLGGWRSPVGRGRCASLARGSGGVRPRRVGGRARGSPSRRPGSGRCARGSRWTSRDVAGLSEGGGACVAPRGLCPAAAARVPQRQRPCADSRSGGRCVAGGAAASARRPERARAPGPPPKRTRGVCLPGARAPRPCRSGCSAGSFLPTSLPVCRYGQSRRGPDAVAPRGRRRAVLREEGPLLFGERSRPLRARGAAPKARQLLAVDHSARASMKNAASCEN